jgi:hypothetical protein
LANLSLSNWTNADSNIATDPVVSAPADGPALLLAFMANTINATLYNKLSYNFIRDIAYGIRELPYGMCRSLIIATAALVSAVGKNQAITKLFWVCAPAEVLN